MTVSWYAVRCWVMTSPDGTERIIGTRPTHSWTWDASAETYGRIHAFYGDFNRVSPITQYGSWYQSSTAGTALDIPGITTQNNKAVVLLLPSGYLTSTFTFTVPTSPPYTEHYDNHNTTPDFAHAIASYEYGSAGTSTGTLSYPASSSSANYRTGIAIEINTTLAVVVYESVTASDAVGIDTDKLPLEVSVSEFVECTDTCATSSGSITLSVAPDSIYLNELVSVALSHNIYASDSISIQDSIGYYSETIFFSDRVSVELQSFLNALEVQAYDLISLSDSASSSVAVGVNAYDTISYSESTTASPQVRISKDESIYSSDTATARISISVSKDEGVSLTEATNVQIEAVAPRSLSVSDSISTSDSVFASETVRSQCADSIYISEQVPTPRVSVGTFITDSITCSESVDVKIGVAATVADSIYAIDSVSTRIEYLTISRSDSISLADSISIAIESIPPRTVSVTDGMAALELVGIKIPYNAASVIDSTTTSEYIKLAIPVLTSIQDSILISESITVRTALSVSVQDSIVTYESISTNPTISVTASEQAALSDESNINVSVNASVADELHLGDISQQYVGVDVAASEQVYSQDYIQVLLDSLNLQCVDSIAIYDAAVVFLPGHEAKWIDTPSTCVVDMKLFYASVNQKNYTALVRSASLIAETIGKRYTAYVE